MKNFVFLCVLCGLCEISINALHRKALCVLCLPCEMRSLFLWGELCLPRLPCSIPKDSAAYLTGVGPRKRPGQAGRWYWGEIFTNNS